MPSWYVLTHNSAVLKSLTVLIQRLGVEVFSPSRTTSRKRKDRPSCIETQTALFPGYLLLRFDPEVIHTTDVTALSGAHGFVQFGGRTYVLQDSIVDALKAAPLLRSDRALDCIEYRNLPSDLEKTIRFIVDMKSDAARKAAFLALMAEGAAVERLISRRPDALCYSRLHIV
ncbi:transcription termination/antitermination NusG family protein [Pseudomonas sp. DC3000-4b1]|uniref:transcription termination/antitermination NusG family protein n=1 Tax=unclassified Pseudomonas TaxID=196821 RepID=UPI003CF8D509